MSQKHLLDWFSQATDSEIAEGKAWYASARQECDRIAEKYGVDLVTVAKVVAVISPLTEWDVNVAEADRMIGEFLSGEDFRGTGKGYRSLPANREKAWAILSGEAVEFKGPKVNSFLKNILEDDGQTVTVDTWAARAWSHPGWNHTVSEKVYWEIAADYREVARKVGMSPAELQAVVWVVIRNRFNRDAITAAIAEYKSAGYKWQDWRNN